MRKLIGSIMGAGIFDKFYRKMRIIIPKMRYIQNVRERDDLLQDLSIISKVRKGNKMARFEGSFSRKVTPPRKEMEDHVPKLEKMNSQSERIRYLIKTFPDARDREISDFLDLNRPQWVWNVRNQNLKKGTK